MSGERVDFTAEDVSVLAAFAVAIMDAFPDGGIDGGDLQDIAEKAGLLRLETMPTPCGEFCACLEFLSAEDFPAECYRFTDTMRKVRDFDIAKTVEASRIQPDGQGSK